MTLSERIARGPEPVTVRCAHCGGTYLPRDLELLRADGFHMDTRPDPAAWAAMVDRLRAAANPPESPAVARMRAAAIARGTLASRPADHTLGDRTPEDRS